MTKLTTLTAATFACFALTITTAAAAPIAGADFDDSPVFNGGGSIAASTHDFDVADDISVSGWSVVGGGSGFDGGLASPNLDANAQVGMPNSPVIKIDGAGSQSQPSVGTLPGGLQGVSFDLTIPSTKVLDLSDITWQFRQATDGSSSVRWLAFKTSLDANLIYSEVGLIRNAFDAESVDLSGAAYQNLSGQTVTFTWYAGGNNSGDIDFDTVIINGTVSDAPTTPEPSTLFLAAFGLMGLLVRRRKRNR